MSQTVFERTSVPHGFPASAHPPGILSRNARAVLSCLFFVSVVAFIAGDVHSFTSFGGFVLGFLLPTWLLVTRLFEALRIEPAQARLFAGCASLIAVAPLFVLRSTLAWPPWLFDLGLSACVWLLVLRTGVAAGLMARIRHWTVGPERIWILVVIPALFALTWLGYEVHVGETVRYYGLSFIDFGNLVSIVNVIKASNGIPEGPVVGTGHLAYHWLFFTIPAWASEFAGVMGDSGSALKLADLVSALLFYAVLVQSCRSVWTNDSRGPAITAGLAIFALSTIYAYQVTVQVLNRSWFSVGTRNALVLQLPHSLACFGNNTLALAAILLAMIALRSWSTTKNRMALLTAATFVAILPGYSVTLTFAAALAIGLETVRGAVKRPIFALACFAAIGLAGVVVFVGIGLLAVGYAGVGGIALSFDDGQFLQNLLLSFAPITFSLLIYASMVREPEALPYISLLASCAVVPMFVETTGSVAAANDFSMKNGSLYLAAAAPVFAFAARWAFSSASALVKVLLGLLVLGGVVNSATYAGQFLYYRLIDSEVRYEAVSRTHFDALRFVRALPNRTVLIDQLSMQFVTCDPAVLIAAKRVLIASRFEGFAPTSEYTFREAAWQRWQSSGFASEFEAAKLAADADVLVAGQSIQSASWQLLRTFDDVHVYRSALRSKMAE